MAESLPTKRQCPCKYFPQCLSSFTAAEYGDLHSLSRKPEVALRRCPGGYTPLHYAAQHGHAAATAMLLGMGSDVDGRPGSSGSNPSSEEEVRWCGATPLHRASFSGAVAAIQVLIQFRGSAPSLQQQECDLFARDKSFGDMMTPLHKAAAGGRPLAIQLLLDTLRSRNTNKDSDATCSNHEAFERDEPKITLLRKGLAATDAQGRTPLEVARSIETIQEAKSVKRWNNVAGSLPDWDRCIAILTAAEKEVGLIELCHSTNEINPSQTGAFRVEIPSLPKHLLSADTCLDCGVKAGSCVTASWEAALRSNLALSATEAALSVNGNLELCIECPTSTTKEASSRVKESSKSTPKGFAGNQRSSINSKRNVENPMLGLRCSLCTEVFMALFRGDRGALVCRACSTRQRKETQLLGNSN